MSQIFRDIKILDFTTNLAGPVAVAMFADQGAEVIKIERPVVGDDGRHFAPEIDGPSCMYWWSARGKKSVTIDLRDPEGLDIIYKMVKDVDIVCESYRPGVMKRLGLDYDTLKEIKPDLIYCSISTYGQDGDEATKPGYDVIAQAQSGFIDLTGEAGGPCYKTGIVVGDYVGGFNAYNAMITALYHMKMSGEGQYIDVSLIDGLVSMNNAIELEAFTNMTVSRTGNHSENLCPYGIFKGKNGQYAVIGAVNDTNWTRLCTAIGRKDMLTEYSSLTLRCKNSKKIIAAIEEWLQTFDNISDAMELLDAQGIACSKVKTTEDVINDPHLIKRGTIGTILPPPSMVKKGYGPIAARGPWIKYSKTPYKIGQPADLGQHNYEILERYGMSRDEIDRLQHKWQEAVKAM